MTLGPPLRRDHHSARDSNFMGAGDYARNHGEKLLDNGIRAVGAGLE